MLKFVEFFVVNVIKVISINKFFLLKVVGFCIVIDFLVMNLIIFGNNVCFLKVIKIILR